ncbi:MAG TPA: VOC family protein [Kofleriaceae bacterium]|nr:VOC family protein [Kofleriaceae bacterium]
MPPDTGLLSDLVLGIDHVGVCVGAMDDAGARWAALLGVPVVDREDVAPQRTTAAFLRLPDGAAAVELVCPMPGNAGLEKFVAQRGDALHHVAFAVSDITAALARLEGAGVELIDRAPRKGAGGHLVAFLHPRALGGTLVELVQRTH